MASQRSKFQKDSHFRILHHLQDNPEMSQRKLAEAVGVSVGGVNYVLNALIDKGLVQLGTFTASEDKRRYAYVLTPKGIARRAVLTKAFLARKMEEYEALREEIEALSGELGPSDSVDATRKS
jgi:EPS-associated MarR family transcriptional regulator